MKKTKAAKSQIKGISKTYGLYSKLVQKIQIAVVQFVALYVAELWCKNKKNYEKDLQ